MKAIILAAGEGKRIRPYTNDRPKCLIEVHGKTLLDWQLQTFHGCNVKDIVVVKGYKEHKIDRDNVRFYVNNNYAITNMVATLWCAKDDLIDDVIVSYADIIFEPLVLKTLIDSPYDISIVVDKNWEAYWRERFHDPLSDAESLIMDQSRRIKNIGQKTKSRENIHAQYIGLMRFKGDGLEVLKEVFDRVGNVTQTDIFLGGNNKPFKKLFLTDLLQGLIDEGNDLYAVPIQGGWLEMDTQKDYEIISKSFSNGNITRFSQKL